MGMYNNPALQNLADEIMQSEVAARGPEAFREWQANTMRNQFGFVVCRQCGHDSRGGWGACGCPTLYTPNRGATA